MSASSNVARRAVARNPLLGNARALSRGVSPAVLGRHVSRHAKVPAIAILIPLRSMGTEHHRPDGPLSGPPPGFNAEMAKKPLPKDPSTTVAKKEEKKLDAQPKESAVAKPAEASAEATKAEVVSTKEGVMEKSDAAKKDQEEKKLTLWQKVKKEAQHYWDGSKLLGTEIKISWRLALKMAAGYELTRRENKQLQRTVQDLGRLVPFSVFIIVPLGEALLPLALKLFPNMLPSTFEGPKSKEAKATLLRSTRKEVSTFLRQTLGETGLPLSQATTQREEFSNFFRKVRATGEAPTAEDVIKVCKVFRDDLTLDNLSRPQLVSMCRYMNLNTFGTDMMLRYQIRHRMRQIKRDDKAISFEGVDSLTVAELQGACAARGIRTHSVSPARMRSDLQTWLDLRLKEGVPSTLLVLSNAYMYGQGSGEGSSQIEALVGVLSAIPEELYHEIELEVHTAEGAATNKQRLEVIKEQQDLIEDEAEQDHASTSSGFATPRDVDDIDEKEERQALAEAEGLGKKQVGEMVDAEKELNKAAETAEMVEAEIKASAGAAKEEQK
ncbi:Letm1 RBD domain-containing protein [Fusarium falciforme]|uniref:LETM1 domain-containing protein ylh47 n=1 Tax=Fusarium falciforme TaxID=195108 RepID=A0A9W8UU41_9HYPO|nr:Letm1 RBD domain-containing protein [Fusarium falciforme]KAJ4179731.1 LETM1 domain-containing protein ylh47 [Fusarium falciforme]KAJ4203253.1 LETM1 domain-containing protein ylh47 [Fusarium falciforme]KAJ4232398.1 LETM1 domain-containing protein ylh47 [Fusarium falciforme]WAO94706.1 Letm1 RBD domain-containing protein [Fusarium falciforme]